MPANEINLTKSNVVKEPTPEEIQDYIVRQVSVLDRHVDQFEIEGGDAGTHYEWHPDDVETHHRLLRKGFVVDNEAGAKSQFSHTDGSGAPRIGDVRCYSIPLWKKQILDKVEREKAARAEDPRRVSQDFAQAIQGDPRLEDNTQVNSARRVSGMEIPTILNQR